MSIRTSISLGALLCLAVCAPKNTFDVQAKADDLHKSLSGKKGLSEFQEHLVVQDFKCKIRDFEHSFDWKRDFPEEAENQTPEIVLLCFWREEVSPMAITYGSIIATAYAIDGAVIAYEVDDIYTGP